MRFSILYLACIAFMFACNNKSPVADSPGTADSIFVAQDKTAVNEKVDTSLIAAEMNEYKARITERIGEYDAEIDKLKKDREIENDQVRKGEYSIAIEKREKNKKYLQERLNQFGDRMNNGWAELKNDIQRFFDQENVSK